MVIDEEHENSDVATKPNHTKERLWPTYYIRRISSGSGKATVEISFPQR